MEDDDIPKQEKQPPADDDQGEMVGTEMPQFLKRKPPVISAGEIPRGQHWPYW
jgi:hypothetical protein